jgi:hypothetical protein
VVAAWLALPGALAGQAAPLQLHPKSGLGANGAALNVGAQAIPCVADWNGDGLADLLCGDGSGNVHLFPNTGTREAPVYESETLLQAQGVNVNFNVRSAVRVCDWDGDGLPDLLGSGSAFTGWCRNTGSRTQPVLASPVPLQAPVAGPGLVAIDHGSRMRLELADWDCDGSPDLLIGGWDGFVHFYRGYRFGIRAIRCEGGGQRRLEWQSAEFLHYDVLRGATPDGIESLVASQLPSGGATTSWTDSCAEDRQFYRVRIAAPGM